jgi:CubicO group peptidase (beta-lactamase class C family)
MKKTALVVSAASFALLLNACMDLPPLPAVVERGDYGAAARHVTEIVNRNMEKSGARGLSIALVDDQRVVWASGFGWADEKAGVRATPETVYLSGPITTLVTATAVMQLQEKGLLDIDRPFIEYMPDFRIGSRFANARPFTIRELLTHHAGLPSGWLKGAYTEKPESPDRIFGFLPEAFMTTAPGTVYDYSSIGYSLLGALVAKVSGRDFASQIETGILAPLGMTSSSLAPGEKIRRLIARPYKKGKPDAEKPRRDVAADGLFTSVTDLARLMQAVFAGGLPILRPETAAEMMKPQGAPALDMDLKMGLGWHLYDPGELSYAGRTAFNEGGTLHYQASFITLPDHKLGVIALSNSTGSGALMYRACTDALKIMVQAKTGITPPAPPVLPPDTKTPPPSSVLNAIAGDYATSFGNVKLTPKKDRLDASISGYGARLVPLEGGGFRPEIRFMGFAIKVKELDGITAEFEKVGGLDAMIGKTPSGRYLAGTKTPEVPIPAAWSKRAGSYRLVNRGNDQLYIDNVELSAENGRLTIEFSLPGITRDRAKFILLPISDTAAVTAGYGRFMGETINVIAANGIETINYSGLIFRRE